MSILIKGMEMPTEGMVITIYKLNDKFYASVHGTELSPLILVPKHGRLIDGEEVLRAMNTWSKYGYDERCRLVPWNENLVPYVMFEDMVRAVVGMPTIIEAEE